MDDGLTFDCFEKDSAIRAIGMTTFWGAEVNISGEEDPVMFFVASTSKLCGHGLLGATMELMGELQNVRGGLLASPSNEFQKAMNVDIASLTTLMHYPNSMRGCPFTFKYIAFDEHEGPALAKCQGGLLVFEKCTFEDNGVSFAQAGVFNMMMFIYLFVVAISTTSVTGCSLEMGGGTSGANVTVARSTG